MAYTNAFDGDKAEYYAPGATLPSSCGSASNDTGAIVVNVGDLPQATSAGQPTDSYGFIRFRATVE